MVRLGAGPVSRTITLRPPCAVRAFAGATVDPVTVEQTPSGWTQVYTSSQKEYKFVFVCIHLLLSTSRPSFQTITSHLTHQRRAAALTALQAALTQRIPLPEDVVCATVATCLDHGETKRAQGTLLCSMFLCILNGVCMTSYVIVKTSIAPSSSCLSFSSVSSSFFSDAWTAWHAAHPSLQTPSVPLTLVLLRLAAASYDGRGDPALAYLPTVRTIYVSR